MRTGADQSSGAIHFIRKHKMHVPKSCNQCWFPWVSFLEVLSIILQVNIESWKRSQQYQQTNLMCVSVDIRKQVNYTWFWEPQMFSATPHRVLSWIKAATHKSDLVVQTLTCRTFIALSPNASLWKHATLPLHNQNLEPLSAANTGTLTLRIIP